jgi:hypothetical protein
VGKSADWRSRPSEAIKKEPDLSVGSGKAVQGEVPNSVEIRIDGLGRPFVSVRGVMEGRSRPKQRLRRVPGPSLPKIAGPHSLLDDAGDLFEQVIHMRRNRLERFERNGRVHGEHLGVFFRIFPLGAHQRLEPEPQPIRRGAPVAVRDRFERAGELFQPAPGYGFLEPALLGK